MGAEPAVPSRRRRRWVGRGEHHDGKSLGQADARGRRLYGHRRNPVARLQLQPGERGQFRHRSWKLNRGASHAAKTNQTEHLFAGGAIRRAHFGLEVRLCGDTGRLLDAVSARPEAVGGAAGVVDGTGSGGVLHCLFQLRAHRETTILVATSIARHVYKPDPPACAPHGWRATWEAAMDYYGVKEK